MNTREGYDSGDAPLRRDVARRLVEIAREVGNRRSAATCNHRAEAPAFTLDYGQEMPQLVPERRD